MSFTESLTSFETDFHVISNSGWTSLWNSLISWLLFQANILSYTCAVTEGPGYRRALLSSKCFALSFLTFLHNFSTETALYIAPWLKMVYLYDLPKVLMVIHRDRQHWLILGYPKHKQTPMGWSRKTWKIDISYEILAYMTKYLRSYSIFSMKCRGPDKAEV